MTSLIKQTCKHTHTLVSSQTYATCQSIIDQQRQFAQQFHDLMASFAKNTDERRVQRQQRAQQQLQQHVSNTNNSNHTAVAAANAVGGGGGGGLASHSSGGVPSV